MTFRSQAALSLAAALSVPLAWSQGTAADYERAAGLRERFRGLVQNGTLGGGWLDATRYWHGERDGQGRFSLVLVDAAAPGDTSRVVLDQPRLEALFQGPQVEPLRVTVHGDDGRFLAVLEGGIAWSFGKEDSVATRIEPQDAVAAHVAVRRAGRGPRRSRRGGSSTHLGIVNGTDAPLDLFWISTSGESLPYGNIAPGEMRWQQSFAGHLFELRPTGAGEQARGSFWVSAESEAGFAVVRALGKDPAAGDEEPSTERDRGRKRGESPSGDVRAFLRDGNLWISSGGSESQVTSRATGDPPLTGPLRWSPDGSALLCQTTEPGEDHTIYFVDSAPDDRREPRLVSQNYTKPGDRIRRTQPRLFRRTKGSEDVLTEVPIQSPELFDTPWSIKRLEWDDDSRRFTFLYNERGHGVMRWLGVDALTGETTTLVEDDPATFFDYTNKLFLHRFEGSKEALWMSERSGWNHLYLVDEGGATPPRAVTQGEWLVRAVESVDDEKRTALLQVAGRRPGEDPYHVHYARLDVDTGELTELTESDGTHRLNWSPDGRWYIDRWSRVDHAPVWELRRSSDGGLVTELGRADARPLNEAEWRAPERFAAKGRDGSTDIYGIVIRPTNFDPELSYPVIENIYAGPHGAHVPKSWSVHRKSMELAELGFIVVQIDGMGTNWRSKAFHDVCWKNLGDAGFPDRIAWLRAFAETEPAADLTRVGIYGGSAGGQNAMRALIAHGDFYRVAVADCGCHDNRMDKIWWNEMWMSWPIGPQYDESSNVTQAHRMEGRLLLSVGELDRNVDPASTMQVADALIRANKDFDLLVLPGMGHGALESSYGTRRRRDFFVKELLGVEPRASSSSPTKD